MREGVGEVRGNQYASTVACKSRSKVQCFGLNGGMLDVAVRVAFLRLEKKSHTQ